MRWHADPRTCTHYNDDACPTCDFDGYYRAQDASRCAHDWLDRPESDTRECLICGTEVSG